MAALLALAQHDVAAVGGGVLLDQGLRARGLGPGDLAGLQEFAVLAQRLLLERVDPGDAFQRLRFQAREVAAGVEARAALWGCRRASRRSKRAGAAAARRAVQAVGVPTQARAETLTLDDYRALSAAFGDDESA